ncbi:hypothetical protein LTR93_001104 [Exophiala xenobiotica]|nr:hypothetical protein LTR93_001104 [Exophiala xenobiotica]
MACSRPQTAAELRARAVARGYERGAHQEKDSLRKQRRHNDKTTKTQNATLHRYVLWTLLEMQDSALRHWLPPPDEEQAGEHCLRPDIEAPDLATIRDFMRFYATTSSPWLDEELPTVDSLNTAAEWFFAGFARVTGTKIAEEDRKEVYKFAPTTLVEEKLAVNKHRPKNNFTKETLPRIHTTLWTKDNLIFTPERYRIQTTFIGNLYCWTGARLSAFFTGGLRYEDTEIVLLRSKDRPWTPAWKLDQRWVMNNQDPKNIVAHDMFLYNDTGFLLTMAIADGALFGVNSLEDLESERIRWGENVLHLRYNESHMKKPMLRKCTMDGRVTDDPMPKQAF